MNELKRFDNKTEKFKCPGGCKPPTYLVFLDRITPYTVSIICPTCADGWSYKKDAIKALDHDFPEEHQHIKDLIFDESEIIGTLESEESKEAFLQEKRELLFNLRREYEETIDKISNILGEKNETVKRPLTKKERKRLKKFSKFDKNDEPGHVCKLCEHADKYGNFKIWCKERKDYRFKTEGKRCNEWESKKWEVKKENPETIIETCEHCEEWNKETMICAEKAKFRHPNQTCQKWRN